MSNFESVPAILLLNDGSYWKGKSAGKIGTTAGEICFNTSMTGYQEVYTDPSYFGQIMVNTVAHIGNYGAKNSEVESESIKIAGLVCRNFNSRYNRPLADEGLNDYLAENALVAISNVDTRAVVRHIRAKGAMNAIISSETTDLEVLKEQLQSVPSMEGLELASKVTCAKPYNFGNDSAQHRVAVMDFGTKQNILRSLDQRDCFVRVFPATTPYATVRKWDPDGILLSNGPGDPASMDYAIEFARAAVADQMPLMGICLGHQLLALSLGISTFKMHHGHRGSNHPVKNLITGRGEMTSQNHGFAIHPEAIKQHSDLVEITHINLNDGSIEGFRLRHQPSFGVQYHPEACPGPHDARYLFETFIRNLRR